MTPTGLEVKGWNVDARSRILVRRRSMGLVRASLTPEVALTIATKRRRLTRSILRSEALHARPSSNERAVDREVLV